MVWHQMFKVCIIEYSQLIFESTARKVVLPGDYGEFEVLAFHYPIISLLRDGYIEVDEVNFPVRRGIAKFDANGLTVLMQV